MSVWNHNQSGTDLNMICENLDIHLIIGLSIQFNGCGMVHNGGQGNLIGLHLVIAIHPSGISLALWLPWGKKEKISHTNHLRHTKQTFRAYESNHDYYGTKLVRLVIMDLWTIHITVYESNKQYQIYLPRCSSPLLG